MVNGGRPRYGRSPVTAIMHGELCVTGRGDYSRCPDPLCTAIKLCVTALWADGP